MNQATYQWTDPYADERVYIEYIFREGNQYTIYTRHYYDVFSVLTVCGGIWSSLYLIGFGFTIAFSYNLLMSSLIRRLYNFNIKFRSEFIKKKKAKQDSSSSEENTQNPLESYNSGDNDSLAKAKQLYAAELEAQKTGKADLIRCLRDGFGESKAANFDMKTGSLLLHYILCRVMRSR